MNLDPECVQKVHVAFEQLNACEYAVDRAEVELTDALRDALLPVLSAVPWTRQGSNELRMDRAAVEDLRGTLGPLDLYYCEICLNPGAKGEEITLSLATQGITLSGLPGSLAQFIAARHLTVNSTDWATLQAAESRVATARAAFLAAEDHLRRVRDVLLSQTQKPR